MKSDQELLVEAFQRGHAWNPDFPNLRNLDLGRIRKMNGTEPDALDLMASRQEIDQNFDLLVAAWHQRLPVYDGHIGPATRALAELPRCPIPDFAPPPGATFDLGDPELNRIAESYQRMKAQAAATGAGSWPAAGCDPDRQGVHSIRVRLDPSNMPATIRGYHVQALAWVTAAYAEIGLAVRYILAASGDCEIAKQFQGLAGSVIGWNEFPQRDTCNQTIDGRLDTGYAPSDGGKLWANLECHETGHGVGLEHTRGHIMNPSILLVWPLSWKGGPSESTLKRYFGGEPLDVPTPPGPTPEPMTKVWFRNAVGRSVGQDVVASRDFVARAGDVLGTFISVPAT